MTNEQIFNDRVEALNKITTPRVGDFLKLPYGLYTRFTHEWDDSIQTGGSEHGSYYLGDGYCSYSGGLDSGVKFKDIQPTSETKEGKVWFFDKNMSGADRGVDFKIPFRVYELKEGADLSGLPQIKAYEKKQIQDQAEKITRINGNGQPYALPLPELIIMADNLNAVALAHIKQNTGLDFVAGWKGSNCYMVQPMKSQQLAALMLTYNFETKYYNNSHYSNTLFLTFAKTN